MGDLPRGLAPHSDSLVVPTLAALLQLLKGTG